MQKLRHILAHMRAARAYAQASHAKRRKVGSILTVHGTPIASGWNGTPEGHPNECETPDGSATLPTVVHAEINTFRNLVKHDKRYSWGNAQSDLFVTCLPCPDCAFEIASKQKHVTRVFFGEIYRSTSGAELLLNDGVKLYFVDEHYERLWECVGVDEDNGDLFLSFMDSTVGEIELKTARLTLETGSIVPM